MSKEFIRQINSSLDWKTLKNNTYSYKKTIVEYPLKFPNSPITFASIKEPFNVVIPMELPNVLLIETIINYSNNITELNKQKPMIIKDMRLEFPLQKATSKEQLYLIFNQFLPEEIIKAAIVNTKTTNEYIPNTYESNDIINYSLNWFLSENDNTFAISTDGKWASIIFKSINSNISGAGFHQPTPLFFPIQDLINLFYMTLGEAKLWLLLTIDKVNNFSNKNSINDWKDNDELQQLESNINYFKQKNKFFQAEKNDPKQIIAIIKENKGENNETPTI